MMERLHIFLWSLLHLSYVSAVAPYPSAVRFHRLNLPADYQNFCSWSFSRTYYVEIQHRFSTNLTQRSCEEISETGCNGRTISFSSKFLTSQNVGLVPTESLVYLKTRLKHTDLPQSFTSTLIFKFDKTMKTHHDYNLIGQNNNVSLSIHFLQLLPDLSAPEEDKDPDACLHNWEDDFIATVNGDIFSYSEETIRQIMAGNNHLLKITTKSPPGLILKQPLDDEEEDEGNMNKRSAERNEIKTTSLPSGAGVAVAQSDSSNSSSPSHVSTTASSVSNISRTSRLPLQGNSTLVGLFNGVTKLTTTPPPSSSSSTTTTRKPSTTSEKKMSLGEIVLSSTKKPESNMLGSSSVAPVSENTLFQIISVTPVHTPTTTTPTPTTTTPTPTTTTPTPTTTTPTTTPTTTNTTPTTTTTTRTTPTTTPTKTTPTTTTTTTPTTTTTTTRTTPTTTPTTTTRTTPTTTTKTLTPTTKKDSFNSITDRTFSNQTSTNSIPTNSIEITSNSTVNTLVNSTSTSLVNNTESTLENSTVDTLVNSTSNSLTPLIESTAVVEKFTMLQDDVKKSFKDDGIIWPVAMGLVIVIPAIIVFSIACFTLTKKRHIDHKSFFLPANGETDS